MLLPSFLSLSLLILHSRLARGAVRRFEYTITKGNISPDGRTRDAWLINGQTPGPTLTVDQGDQVIVNVINRGSEPISIHWHGIDQRDTPWSDGVPGITQYPIAVGRSFVYNWTAHVPGAYFYHSHKKMQIDDGLRGGIMIRPSKRRPSSDTGPYARVSSNNDDIQALKKAENNPFQLMVYDWKKSSSDYYMEQWAATHIEPLCLDDILINGKGQVVCASHAVMDPLVPPPLGAVTDKGCAFPNNTLAQPFPGSPELVDPDIFYNCQNTSTPLEVFVVTPKQKWVAFNVVNSGALWDLRLAIDNHTMVVFAADGGYVEPQSVETLDLPIGERYQFWVKLDKPLGDYAIRVASAAIPQMVTGYAVLSYKQSIPTKPPVITTVPAPKNPYVNYAGTPINGARDLDRWQLHPFPANPPPAGPADVTLHTGVARPDNLEWTMNLSPWQDLPDNFKPLLFDVSGASSLQDNLYFAYPLGSVVDIIITITAGNPAGHPFHPVHKHGRKAWHLGSGEGEFPYANVADAVAAGFTGLNLVNPPFRDDFLTPLALSGKYWSVIRLKALDPGPTFLHCHIDLHLATGMAVVLLEGMENPVNVPAYYLNQTPP